MVGAQLILIHFSSFPSSACTDKLGVENGDIPDANFNASHWHVSSNSGTPYPAYKARLNGPSVWVVDGSVWRPWIQVDIGYSTNVSGLLTQGDGGTDRTRTTDWVAKIKVATFTGADDPKVYIKDEDGDVKVTQLNAITTVLLMYNHYHDYTIYLCQGLLLFI